MIVAENPKPELRSFKMLMEKTDRLLNSEALKKGNEFNISIILAEQGIGDSSEVIKKYYHF